MHWTEKKTIVVEQCQRFERWLNSQGSLAVTLVLIIDMKLCRCLRAAGNHICVHTNIWCDYVWVYEYWSHTCEHSFHATSCTVSCLVLLNCNSPKLFPSCISVATRMQRFALTNQISITPFHNLLWKVVILIWLVNTKWLVLSWGIETMKFCMASKSCFNPAPL